MVLLILVILLAPKIVPYGYADIVKGAQNLGPVSYTHLDVYKRQCQYRGVIYRSGTIDIEREYYDRQQIRGDTHNRGCLLYTSRCV